MKYTPKQYVRVSKMKDALRLISRCAYLLQSGDMDKEQAKALTYIANCYINGVKTYKEIQEFEQRIETLESKVRE